MKILFFNTGSANPLLGGVQSVTHCLAHYFNSLGHEVYIISINRTSDYLDVFKSICQIKNEMIVMQINNFL